MKKLRGSVLFLAAVGVIAAQTTSPDVQEQKIEKLEQRVEELDQKLRVAERNKELKDEATAESARSAASVTADTGGFTIKSNDGNFLIKIGADLQVDNRTFLGEGSQSLVDTTLLRRVRPTFSGTVYKYCLLYTSDAADEEDSVDLG